MTAPTFGTHWHNETAGAVTSIDVAIVGGTTALYLAIGCSKGAILDSVSGGGLTWRTPTKAQQCGARGQSAVGWRWAQGNPSTGNVTFTFDSSKEHAVAIVRIDGAPTSITEADVFEDVQGNNTIGENGACSGGSDDTDVDFQFTTAGDNRYVMSWNNPRQNSGVPGLTEDGDHAIQFEYISGGGNGSGTAVCYTDRTVASASTIDDAHTLAGTKDWANLVLAIIEEAAAAVIPNQIVEVEQAINRSATY